MPAGKTKNSDIVQDLNLPPVNIQEEIRGTQNHSERHAVSSRRGFWRFVCDFGN